jgi:hypothetical protein
MFSSPRAFQYQLLVFAGLRLALLFLLPAAALFRFGDFQHYYNLAAWSLPGHCLVGPAPCWPLLDYWYEFPPVFPYLSIVILRLVGGGALPVFETYAYALALVLVAADAGTLVVYQALARRLLPPRAAISAGWFYLLMPAPLILSWWTFDGLTTFWMVLALWALIEQRAALASAAVGLGALTKILPVLVLPAAWRALPPRRAAWVTAGAAGIFVAGLAAVCPAGPGGGCCFARSAGVQIFLRHRLGVAGRQRCDPDRRTHHRKFRAADRALRPGAGHGAASQSGACAGLDEPGPGRRGVWRRVCGGRCGEGRRPVGPRGIRCCWWPSPGPSSCCGRRAGARSGSRCWCR